ncbi:NADPH-dependent F420 reductase [Spirosoma areae]
MAQKIAVLGTGMVGRTIADRLTSIGYTVVIGTRDVTETLAKTEPDAFGNPPFATWQQQHETITLSPFAEAANQASVLINCTSGQASVEVLNLAGEANLAGKLLIDIANPLDFSKGFPPSLSVCNTDSLAEEIQRAFPSVRVVKTLNTMNAYLMANPALLPGDHTVFVSGNEEAAKTEAIELLKAFGWQDPNIIDLGDLTTARATEMLLPIWTRLYGALKTPMFNFHVNVATNVQ